VTPQASLMQWRVARGLSKQALGDMIGCSQPMVSHIELGRREPARKLANTIERVCGIPVSEWDDAARVDLRDVVGEHIRVRREALNMTKAALARRIGSDWRHVHKYEKGVAMPQSARLLAIADALDTSVGALLLGDEALASASAPSSEPEPAPQLFDQAALDALIDRKGGPVRWRYGDITPSVATAVGGE